MVETGPNGSKVGPNGSKRVQNSSNSAKFIAQTSNTLAPVSERWNYVNKCVFVQPDHVNADAVNMLLIRFQHAFTAVSTQQPVMPFWFINLRQSDRHSWPFYEQLNNSSFLLNKLSRIANSEGCHRFHIGQTVSTLYLCVIDSAFMATLIQNDL